jgi:hypothetical protein
LLTNPNPAGGGILAARHESQSLWTILSDTRCIVINIAIIIAIIGNPRPETTDVSKILSLAPYLKGTKGLQVKESLHLHPG